jgi:hypothetical protein
VYHPKSSLLGSPLLLLVLLLLAAAGGMLGWVHGGV